MATPKLSMKVITAPAIGHVIDAPPVVVTSDKSVDYACGRCDTVLLHSELNQVHGVLFRCTQCGSYNSID